MDAVTEQVCGDGKAVGGSLRFVVLEILDQKGSLAVGCGRARLAMEEFVEIVDTAEVDFDSRGSD